MNIGYNFKTCILELWGCKYYTLCIYKYIYIVDTLPPIKNGKLSCSKKITDTSRYIKQDTMEDIYVWRTPKHCFTSTAMRTYI